MNYKILILDEAKKDLKDALVYYKDINQKLSDRFLISFKDSLALIKENPLSFQIRYDNVRVQMLKTFPYLIHYSIYNDTVVIKLICHSSRDSELNIF